MMGGIGPRLKALRESRGLSQFDVYRACGVMPSHLSKIECGRTEPRLETLERVLAALGSTVGEFMAEAESGKTLALNAQGGTE